MKGRRGNDRETDTDTVIKGKSREEEEKRGSVNGYHLLFWSWKGREEEREGLKNMKEGKVMPGGDVSEEVAVSLALFYPTLSAQNSSGVDVEFMSNFLVCDKFLCQKLMNILFRILSFNQNKYLVSYCHFLLKLVSDTKVVILFLHYFETSFIHI